MVLVRREGRSMLARDLNPLCGRISERGQLQGYILENTFVLFDVDRRVLYEVARG